MTAAPDAVLTLAYWLHMLGTAAWVGAPALVVLVVLPAARRHMDGPAHARFSAGVLSRLQSLGWLSLALLAATGMLQLSSSPHYTGFLAIDSCWALAILVKHMLFGVVILLSAYLTWFLGPSLQRELLTASRKIGEAGELPSPLVKLQGRQALLIKANLVLGAAILALTALARVS